MCCPLCCWFVIFLGLFLNEVVQNSKLIASGAADPKLKMKMYSAVSHIFPFISQSIHKDCLGQSLM